MSRRNYFTVFVFITLFLVLSSHSQSIPISSYSPMTNYQGNSLFELANSQLKKSYNSLLSQTAVSSVYVYNTKSLASLIITYVDRYGKQYRGTANYIPSTNQFSISSFGPVQSRQTSSTSVPYVTIIGQQNGIGMTNSPTPPNKQANIIPGPNPDLRYQKLTVLLPNSTSTVTPRTNPDNQQNTDSTSSRYRSLRNLY